MADTADLRDLGGRFKNLLSQKGSDWYNKAWPQFKEEIKGVNEERWRRFHDRHELLRIAALRGREEAVKLLLEPSRFPDVNNKNQETGMTALHEAAWNRNLAVFKLLLEAGALVNLRTEFGGDTALHRVLKRVRHDSMHAPSVVEKAVQMLLEKGADPVSQNYKWYTPLHLAALNSHAVSLRMLLERSNRPQGRLNETEREVGDYPIHLAARMGHVEEIKVLLKDTQEYINITNEEQQTPLSLAAFSKDSSIWSNHNEAVKLLLDNGADATRMKIKGQTMLDWAAWNEGKSNTANTILRKEYKSWPSSWQQEPGALRSMHSDIGPNINIETALGSEATAMWFFLRYCDDFRTDSKRYQSSVKDMICVDHELGSIYDQINPESKDGFAWFHVPDTDMQWVEALHSRICKDPRASKSDAAQIDSESFREWFYMSRPHRLEPTFRHDVHYGPERAVSTVFVSIPYMSVERHRDRIQYEALITQPSPPLNEHTNEKRDLRRRTLDRYNYHHIRDTSGRDISQVMLRASQAVYCRNTLDPEIELLQGSDFDHFRSQWWPGDEAKDEQRIQNGDGDLLMVDQVCLWIIGDDTIISSFPSTWQKGADPLKRILAYLEDARRPPMTSVYELATFIMEHCSTMHTESWLTSFRSMSDKTADLQVRHFKCFIEYCYMVDQPQAYSKHELQEAEENLSSIRREIKNLCEVTDIQDELHIIDRIFDDQKHIIAQFVAMNAKQPINWPMSRLHRQETHLQEQIKSGHAAVLKLLDVADRTHAAILQLLDLKQQQATVTEARSSRKQAEDTARQNNTVQLFTFVTIFFTPASFMAAFFAIPDLQLPGIDTSSVNGAVGIIVVFSTVIWLPIIAYIVSVECVAGWFGRNKGKERRLRGDRVRRAPNPEVAVIGGGSRESRTSFHRSKATLGWRGRAFSSEKTEDVENGAVTTET